MNATTIAGHSVRRSARRQFEQAGLIALAAAALLTIGVLVGADAVGGLGALAGAIGIVVGAEAWHRVRLARRYAVGAVGEERVASRLWVVEAWDWLVSHDVLKEGGGNIDHLVHSPAVTFVIDTKASHWQASDIEQAHRHIRWAARRYGAERELVAVICVQRSTQRPRLIDGVWVVGAPHLTGFLRDRG